MTYANPAWRVTRRELAAGYWQYRVQLPDAGADLGAALVSVPARGPAHLTGLYVAPVWRGRGIARALVAHIVAAHAATGLTAHVAPYGTRGLSKRALAAFYRRHGAVVSRRYACHWPPAPAARG